MTEIFEVSPIVFALVPIIVGLVLMLKNIGLPSRYAPLASIALGIVFLWLAGITLPAFIIQGIMTGLLASGLWSSSKAVVNG